MIVSQPFARRAQLTHGAKSHIRRVAQHFATRAMSMANTDQIELLVHQTIQHQLPAATLGEKSTAAIYLIVEGAAAQRKDLDNAIDVARAKLDTLSEMGETESQRLQMAMDRLSKLMSTLSNLLKKASDTEASIVQNMKC